MKKVMKTLLVVVMVIMIVAGCKATPKAPETKPDTSIETEKPADDVVVEDEKEITLAYICKALDQEWFQDVSAQMTATAKELGVKEIILIDSQMNPDVYISSLDNMISQGVDGIIVCVPDQNLSRVTVNKCEEAGIPVLADADPLIENGEKLAPSLELDAFLVGQQCTEWLAEEVKSKDLIKDVDSTGYMLLTMDTVSSCVPRSEGQAEAWGRLMPDFPQDNIFTGDYTGETEKGFNVMASTITANPQIKTWFVTAANEEGAIGAVRALEQANLDVDAVVVGLGAYFAKDEFKKDYSAMKSAAYFDPTVDGEEVVKAMVDHIRNGTEIFGEYKKDGQQFGMYPLGARMVTPENYVEIMGDAAN